MPGVLSSDIRRPFPDDPDRYQIAFGTFDDPNVPEEDTYLPMIRESKFCAPCHYGVFWDTTIYNSFGEWLASPYSDTENGKTCQECHMPAPTIYDGAEVTNVAPGKGGIERDPMTIHAHLQRGSTDQEFLKSALTMTAEVLQENDSIVVEVSLFNDNTGHHIPTDSPLRHLILLVEAEDSEGHELALQNGNRLPEWCGIGNPKEGYYAGRPGTAYAKILQELWTNVIPTAAYWNQTSLVSDNRIAAMQTANSSYIFSTNEASNITVSVTLIYRRAYRTLVDQKGWDAPDIIMAQQILAVGR